MPDFILRSTGLGGRLSELAHGRRGLLHKAVQTSHWLWLIAAHGQ